MILDSTLQFSNAQAITATAASTNIVDLGATGTVYGAASALVRDVGLGTQVPLCIRVVETFNNLTSLIVTVETDDNAGFSSAAIVYTSPTYVLADLAVGARLILPDWLPAGTKERYVRLKYTIAGTAPTLGKITAAVSMGNQSNGNK